MVWRAGDWYRINRNFSPDPITRGQAMPTAGDSAWRSAVAAMRGHGFAAAILASCGFAWLSTLYAEEPRSASAIQGQSSTDDMAAIRAAAAAYRTALTNRDEAAIRQAWSADGDVVDGWGNRLSAADVSDVAGDPGDGVRPEVHVGESRLRLITPDVALEDGFVDVIIPGTTAPIEGWFSAIWVKQGGAWKLAGIREAERPVAVGADTLDDLDWMVGEWTLVPEDGATKDALPAMEMSVRWDAGRMFLVRNVRLTSATQATETVAVDVQQRIGWDPIVGRIRSWSFSSDGTRSEATWLRDGNSWITKVTTVLVDGAQSSAVHIYSYDGRERCEWRTMQDPFGPDDRIPVRATWVRKPKGGAK